MTRTNHSMLAFVIAGLGLVAPACTTEATNVTPEDEPPAGNTTGGEDTTYDHDNESYSPWEYLDRLVQEGPARYTSKVHSCPKVRYATLGTVLRSLGVNMAATDQV